MIKSYAEHEFNWLPELEKTVVQSLATSFGLDFLLLEDKLGGNVDTIHNVRAGVSSSAEKAIFDERGAYNPDPYHKHAGYKAQGAADKASHAAGTLFDPYRGITMKAGDKRALDHVISANEIHNDPGRVLAGLDGVELANKQSNLQSTHNTINCSKQNKAADAYLRDVSRTISLNETKLARMQADLERMPRETPQQQHEARQVEAGIHKIRESTDVLKSIDADSMRARDAEARTEYEREVNQRYYAGSKFLKNTAVTSLDTGVRMGLRQVLGLIAAEVWFELRAKLPKAMKGLHKRFSFDRFMRRVGALLKGIWTRVQARFRDLISEFVTGFSGGVAANLTTVLINVFTTTTRGAGKIIREMWGSLAAAFKVMMFNPEGLSETEQYRAVIAALTVGAGAVAGSLVLGKLAPLLTTPVVGGALASFLSALVSGLVAMGLTWSLLHSPLAAGLWDFMARSKHVQTLAEFTAVNAQLDSYLLELAQVELAVDPGALTDFAAELLACNSELERAMVLKFEVEKREIVLPFALGDAGSTRKWLSGLGTA